MPATCATCELHAESTFRVEGMDCREEVALLERRFKHVALPENAPVGSIETKQSANGSVFVDRDHENPLPPNDR